LKDLQAGLAKSMSDRMGDMMDSVTAKPDSPKGRWGDVMESVTAKPDSPKGRWEAIDGIRDRKTGLAEGEVRWNFGWNWVIVKSESIYSLGTKWTKISSRNSPPQDPSQPPRA
jgi:hypothetical protein